MSESNVNRVSRPPSSRRRSSSDSPRHNKSSKRFRRTSSTSSASNYDDNYQQQDKDGEVLSKPTPNPSSRPSGLYMSPAKLRILPTSLTDKSSAEYQRLAWEALEKTINGRVNNLNTANLPLIIRQLFKENIVRGRGLLARGIIQAQTASPFNTSVYAGLVSVINTKFPQIGELIIKRLISSFRHQYIQNHKMNCIAITRFIAHLVNQNVLHEIVPLQILVLLSEHPSDDSVELGIGFLKESGQKLSEMCPRGLDLIFSTLRNLLYKSSLEKRTKDLIEVIFAVRKDKFKNNPAIQSGLDLVDENNQYTHMVTLDDTCEPESMLDAFKHDDQYKENEEKYKEIRRTLLDDSSSNSSDTDEEGGAGGGKKDDGDEEEQEMNQTERASQQTIIDQTETNLVTLRDKMRKIIQSSVGAEECEYKLRKMNLRRGEEMELCQIIVDTCAQQRTYE